MKRRFLLLLSLGLGLAVASCDRTTTEDNTDPTPTGTDKTIKGSITSNITLKAIDKNILEGFVYVEAGATLTIEPGTVIKGDKATKATLIVKPGGKIIAEGTVEKPIVFTSNQPKGSRNYGDWGGVVLLGKAPVNKNPATIEGENISTFGGSDAADNSGILKYVRIEFGGIAFETDKEINGLTFGGVGSGTIIDYVQISFSGDDSYEWFGGTVNAKHLIAYKGLDDDFDTDWGYAGRVQYGLALRDPKVADQCSCSDSNGFESDNDGSGSDASPQTSATFANITIIMGEGTPDAKFRSGYRIRRNSALSIYNSLVAGAYPKGGLELGDAATQKNFVDGKSEYKGLILAGMTKGIVAGDEAKLKDASRKNQFGVEISTLGLPSGYNSISGKPSLLPISASILLNSGVTLPSGFEANTYVGAFNTTDWTATWTNFDPQNTEY
ncbi:T9SS C-terminal target domain-containing protein [Lacihabitans sp. LS3-19]|uniref:T9SS C-terminal target domain-containing protein n=1 Tax=Lacihabitans sp. LS3-19 TaxID=2487335 RepID=UPI0020CC3782|nr:T9SS C-terminal target domain-containing protein [Lacihabitans sp. LS3-19]MCP9770594.1 T9SS C-terminal target domain-containing protein [Lacihabitans sp. LS3-19]